MPLPLSETIVAGVGGHIADHNLIHDTANRLEGIALNALEYDVRPANSGATNRVNLGTAIAAAVAQARPLYIPPGNYTLTYDASNKNIAVGGKLQLIGAGRDLTFLTVNPTVMTFTELVVLMCQTAGDLYVSDMTINGPTAGSGTDNFDETSKFVNKLSAGDVTFERLKFTGNLGSPMQRSHASDVTIRYNDCKITAYQAAGNFFEGSFAQTKCIVMIDGCEVHDIEALGTSGAPEPDNVGFYIHPHFEVHVSNSVFRNIPRWGIYMNGTGGTAKSKGVFVNNCSFIDAKAIQFSSDGPGQASNITLHNSEIFCRSNDMQINGLVATGSSLVIGAGSIGGTETQFFFSDFDINLTNAVDGAICLALTGTGPVKHVLRNINIRNTSATPLGYGIIAGSTAAGTSVHDWDGVTVSGAVKQPINIRSLDKASIRNLRVEKTSGTDDYVRFEYSQNEVEINGLHVTGAGTGKGVRLDAATTANKVIGRDWRFTGSSSPPIDLTTAGQQRVERRRGVAPTAIASAATLSMYDTNEKCSYDTFRISGTTTINTITPGPFSGKLTLIATGAWSTSATGNIKAKVGTARTVDRAYTFYFNPDTALWYELDDIAAAGGVAAHDLRGASHTDALKPDVALTETIARSSRPVISNTAMLSSGRMHLTAIYLPTATLVTSITYLSSGTALVTGTNQWFALYDSAKALLRQTVDDTSTAWLASAFKTLALTSTFNTTYSGLHYLGVMVAATTPPSLASIAALASTEKIQGLTPIDNGSSNTGLTTTAPATATLSANASNVPYAYVS